MIPSRWTAGASVLLAALAGFGLYRGFEFWRSGRNGSLDPNATGAPSATGSALRSVIPRTRPFFSLNDLTGKPRSIAEWDGKALMINFWATWCEPCRREIPLLKKLHATRARDNFQIIGIAVDQQEAVRRYVTRVGIDYPILVGEQDALSVAGQFGMQEIVLPFTVFTDSRGRVVTLRLGELKEKDAEAILDTVAAIDRGTLPFEEAKPALRRALAGT